MKHELLTQDIINCFYTVYNSLGYGFLEKIYSNALEIEMQKKGLCFQCQYPIDVYYSDQKIGEFFGDFLVDDIVLIELKAVRSLLPEHEAQLINYLNATKIEVGLLLNFGVQPQIKRKVYDNERKKYFGGQSE
jgi:GxxExxY protein